MLCDFEEPEFRGPLFNQLEFGSHILWEPGQVFEKSIGIDRASHCINTFFWNLYDYNIPLNGTILRNRHFNYLWLNAKPEKLLPDFSLNLFIQAKRPTYSSQSNADLIPKGILNHYWHFEITPHQQVALGKLEHDLGNDALVVYACPVFHRQQDLYNHTSNNTIVQNTTFPKVGNLNNHSKWYFDKAGMSGVANPEFELIEGGDFLSSIEELRKNKGEYTGEKMTDNLKSLSENINNVVKSETNNFLSSRYAYFNKLIDRYIEAFEVNQIKGLKEYIQIEVFCSLWKLQWLTF